MKTLTRGMDSNRQKKKDALVSWLSEQMGSYWRHGMKLLLDPVYRELERIKKFPRYTSLSTDLLGPPVNLVDGLSFYYSFNEIFLHHIYAFNTIQNPPTIIDGGANIGLSVIYFKKLYPNSQIIAFEADPAIFQILQMNLNSFGYTDVETVNKALWHTETSLDFAIEGADGGRIAHDADRGATSIETVPTIRLREYIRGQAIDLLKLDVEGAEIQIIRDCADCLQHVEHIFIEYHSFLDEEQRLNELLSILRRNGFRIHINNQFGSPQPFLKQRVRAGMDMQLNIFAYRNK